MSPPVTDSGLTETLWPAGPVLAGLFVFCVLMQVFFQWYFFYRISGFRQSAPDPVKWPPVSVVVCARNELANLRKLIPLLLDQDYPEFEIVIIDDRSEDPMYDFMLEQKSLHDRLRLVRINFTPEGMNPKKFALTMGIKSARFENLLFTDADCFPVSRGWIRAMARYGAGREEITLAYAPYRKERGFLNLLIRYDTFYTAVQYFSFALAGLPYMGVGRNLSYRKALFMRLKGFFPHVPVTGGDDDLFVNKASHADNVAICLDPESYTLSVPKTRFRDWYRQKTRHLSVGRFYRPRDRMWLGLLAGTNLGYYLTLPVLCFFPPVWPILLLGFFLKTVNQLWVLRSVNQRLQEPMPVLLIPFLDFIHSILIFAFSFPARFARRHTWS